MDVVTELLARIGEFFVLGHVGTFEALAFPIMNFVEDQHIAVISLHKEPRRLILDQDFGWMWYNEEGPEE